MYQYGVKSLMIMVEIYNTFARRSVGIYDDLLAEQDLSAREAKPPPAMTNEPDLPGATGRQVAWTCSLSETFPG